MSDQSGEEEEHTVFFPDQIPLVLPGRNHQQENRKRQRHRKRSLSKSSSGSSTSSLKKVTKKKPRKIKESVLDPRKATTRKEWEDMVFSQIPQTGQGGISDRQSHLPGWIKGYSRSPERVVVPGRQ